MLRRNVLPEHGSPLQAADAADLGVDAAAAAERLIRRRDDYAPTPLLSLPALAASLGVGAVHVKDEGRRLGLGSFKALGGAYAVARLAQEAASTALGRPVEAAELQAPDVRVVTCGMTFACATDGNHGRSVAQGAALVGARSVVFIHAGVSAARAAAIASYGAEIVRVDGSYDDSVVEVARVAGERGWTIVSDTTWPGYERIPGLVMQGYTLIVVEALRQLAEAPTHVFVQAGVGGVAAAIAGHLALALGEWRPVFVVVEPARAGCVFASAEAGRLVRIANGEPTVMAMLECCEPSLTAWRVLARAADAFMTVDEDDAVAIMGRLARPLGDDPAIVAGESGGVGLAGLVRALADPQAKAALGLGPRSRVLVVNTEGATDRGRYRELVGLDPDAVPAPLGVDAARLLARLAALGAIGRDPAGRLIRLAASDADKAGRDQFAAWLREAGLAVAVDRIGNVFGLWTPKDARARPALMLGSHIDTVIDAGPLDGCYGVLAALEVVETLKRAGFQPARPIAVAAFTNEEGVRFAPDMMGSLVFAGGLPLADALASRDADARALGDELARIGYAGEHEPGYLKLHAYVELHIEQGPVLDREGVAIGAVENLQGISWKRVTIDGVANHAGTTPMTMRHDAGLAAAWAVAFLRERACAANTPTVATVGCMRFEPDAINVIPSRAVFTVDLRDPDEARLKAEEAALAAFLDVLAAEEGVTISVEALARFAPVTFDARIVSLIEAAAKARGHSVRRVTSGAGHDAQMLARVVPAAMIFAPSIGGVSHNPREATLPADLVAGANVLLDVARRLAEG